MLRMATRDHTVELDAATYDALEVEARRRHIPPEAVVGELVRERLGGGEPATAEQMEATLRGLQELRAEVQGPVDAVALVREGREELERRSLRWLSS